MALSWEDLEALIDETLAAGQQAPSRPWSATERWDCVDDTGAPRPVRSFDARYEVEREALDDD